MTTVACSKRRSSFASANHWATLPLKSAPTMSEAVHNQAALELMRNAPEVFTHGVLEGMAPKLLTWEDLYSETEVAIIKEGLKMRSFNDFLAVMSELFPDAKRAKVVFQTIRLWDQVCDLKEKSA